MQIENKKNIIDGLVVQFYPNNKIKSIGKCYRSLMFKYGEWITYYENGQIESNGTYGLASFDDKLTNEKVLIKDVFFENWKNYYVVKLNEWKYYDVNGILIKQEFISPPIEIYD